MPERILIDAGGTWVRAYLQSRGLQRMLFAMRARNGAVIAAVRRARAQAGAAPMTVGMRGVWTPAERGTWRRKLGSGVSVVSDVELAHALAFGDGPGIYLNAGTGSIAYGRGAGGTSARAGGLGPLLGDDGSAFWIGREFIRRVESRANSFAWTRGVAAGDDPVAAIAARSKAALRAARRGGEASRIAAEAQDDLVGLVASVAARLKTKKPLPLVFGGGLFADRWFAAGFVRRLRARRLPVYLPPVA